MKHRIVITHPIPENGIKLLKKIGTVKVLGIKQKPSRDEILHEIADADAVVTLLSDRVDEHFLKQAPRAHIIANFAVGYDNFDTDALASAGVVGTNTPSLVVADAVAEHAFALMLGALRHVRVGDAYVRAGQYRGWNPDLLVGGSVAGKTLGIVGLGKIGQALCQRAYQLGMHILYTDVRKDITFERDFEARHVKLDTLLKSSDVVSLHVPLLPSTHHLIGEKQLSIMRTSAVLINTARGPVVDEAALIHALVSGSIAGAGVDVYEHEPELVRDRKTGKTLADCPTAILTPHIASATVEARADMSRIVAENIIAVLSGKPALNPVH